jgi:uncharacterized protein YceK
MKITVAVLIMTILILTGCSPVVEALSTPTGDIPSVSDPDTEVRLMDVDWVTPAQIDIGNYFPGARAEFSLRIHNGGDEVGIYNVCYTEPIDTKAGYTMPPATASSWVTVPSVVVVQPKETKEIPVILAVPKGTKISSDWEFQVSITRQGQGNIQVQYSTRWLIEMR